MEAIKTPDYAVYFNEEGYAYLQSLLSPEKYSKLFFITDSNTANLCLPGFLAQLAVELPVEILEFEPGEENKSIATSIQFWHALTELGADRKGIIINIGGGVVTDLGGFVASTFKRGMDFINVPTTLLGMVDASIGGKTGVDLDHLKNQVGVINNPVAVLIDTQFLETLPAAEMRSGLAEMLKHGLIGSKAYWEKFSDLSALATDDLPVLIYESVKIKNGIVIQDPKEKGIRKALNFGHTLGHAIESLFLADATRNTLLHGEAVAAGMVLEAYISLAKNLLTTEEYDTIKKAVLSVFQKVLFTDQDIDAILELLVHDKKNEFGAVQFVLLDGIGNIKINQAVENALIIKAFEDYQQ